MPYRPEELQDRLRIGEDNRWEFKSVEFRSGRLDRHQRDLWAEEIVAFANASGGSLLLGVADNGSIEGMSREELDTVERQVTEICRDSIKPTLAVEIYREQLDGRAFVVVVVPPGYAQHEYDGRSHIRIGSSRRLMTSDERLRLAQRRGQARFRSFDSQTIDDTGFGTLEEQLWKPLLSGHQLADPQIGLKKLGLLDVDERGVLRATVAGVLVCTSEPHSYLPQASIGAVHYQSENPSDGQLDGHEITGPIQQQIRDAVNFVLRNMRVGARKAPGRIETAEYSQSAVFEAVVNAIVHRDYSMRGSRIRLRMFPNRLEINSPGSLPNSLTIDEMDSRQATRNDILAQLLGRMRTMGIDGVNREYIVERRGDGVPTIIARTLALTGQRPQFELLGGAELRVTLPAAVVETVPVDTIITVRTGDRPVPNADLLALYPNRTWTQARTDENGEARLELHSTLLPMTVFAATPGNAAGVVDDWTPSQRSLVIELEPLERGGATIIREGVGSLPGLRGRVNPTMDELGRAYLYTTNIGINGGQAQPVIFVPGSESLHLVDADGQEMMIRVAAIRGRSSVIQYWTPSHGLQP